MLVRKVEEKDAERVAALSGQLGYPMDPKTMAVRIQEANARSSGEVFVACAGDGAVVGWIEIGLVEHLISDRSAVVAALVVEAGMRNRGIGRLLQNEAERWARSRQARRMLVRSRVTREEAHRFYEREGYTRVKTSAVFEKPLGL